MGESIAPDYDPQVGVLRALGRSVYAETGDYTVAAYAMVKRASQEGIVDPKIQQAFEDLRAEGIFPPVPA